jgi:hypothetical protein
MLRLFKGLGVSVVCVIALSSVTAHSMGPILPSYPPPVIPPPEPPPVVEPPAPPTQPTPRRTNSARGGAGSRLMLRDNPGY